MDDLIQKKNDACILTRITSLYVGRLASIILNPMGLSLAEYKILYICMQNPAKKITTAFLENHFQMSHSTSVGLLNHLEKDGWIRRIPNPDNRREKLVVLSSQVETHQKELMQAGQELEARFTENLTPKEVAEYIRISKKILGKAGKEGAENEQNQ